MWCPLQLWERPHPGFSPARVCSASVAPAHDQWTYVAVNQVLLGLGFLYVCLRLQRQRRPCVCDSHSTSPTAFAQGDGVKLGRAIGAKLLHMDQVQVHPTGFVDLADPTNRVKFLGPEALRGAGGIMINDKACRLSDLHVDFNRKLLPVAYCIVYMQWVVRSAHPSLSRYPMQCERFYNELGRRDDVSKAIFDHGFKLKGVESMVNRYATQIP